MKSIYKNSRSDLSKKHKATQEGGALITTPVVGAWQPRAGPPWLAGAQARDLVFRTQHAAPTHLASGVPTAPAVKHQTPGSCTRSPSLLGSPRLPSK